MPWEALPLTLKESLIIVGIACVAAGLLARERLSSRGLGMALIVVGVMMIIAWPLGRMFGMW